MVKKLFKHEFLAYVRVMSVVYIILLTVATAGRCIQFFESDSIAYEIISTISVMTYFVSVLAAFGFSFVLAITRFYKNLFTAEGYLSFTLPVTPSQHILVKAVTAVSMEVVTLVAVFLSGCIITAGDLLSEIWKALIFLLEKAFELAGFHAALIGGEFAILFLLGLFSGILLYYTFICIGQLFKKNRILAAVGAYFVYYILSQVASSVFFIVLSILSTTDIFTRLAEFIEAHPYAAIHSGMGITALLQAVFILVEFVIVKKIITNKLNLE